MFQESSNNTNKLSPQELINIYFILEYCSNNTNKLSPQEPPFFTQYPSFVQIIQINLVLKNFLCAHTLGGGVQIIQINLVLKNLYWKTLQVLAFK